MTISIWMSLSPAVCAFNHYTRPIVDITIGDKRDPLGGCHKFDGICAITCTMLRVSYSKIRSQRVVCENCCRNLIFRFLPFILL